MLITPHVSGETDVNLHRGVDLFCDNLRRYLNGQPLENVVGWGRGILMFSSRTGLSLTSMHGSAMTYGIDFLLVSARAFFSRLRVSGEDPRTAAPIGHSRMPPER